jgi:ribosomal protein S18 acetylase RimI-like enzyme
MSITMVKITREDRGPFLQMAALHFRELNPNFSPADDWRNHYFESILTRPRLFARWIVVKGKCAGFILFGLEDHRFLPRLTGMIYELFIMPEFRRRGVARSCAGQAIEELQAHSPSKIQLEVMDGNKAAEALWNSLGFERVSIRMVKKPKS